MEELTMVECAVGLSAEHVYLWHHAWVARLPRTSKLVAPIVAGGTAPEVPPGVLALVAMAEEPQPRAAHTDVTFTSKELIKLGGQARSRGAAIEIAGISISADFTLHAGAFAQLHGGGARTRPWYFGPGHPGLVFWGDDWLLAIAALVWPGEAIGDA